MRITFRRPTASLIENNLEVRLDGDWIGWVRHAGRASWEATTSDMKSAGMHRTKAGAVARLVKKWRAVLPTIGEKSP